MKDYRYDGVAKANELRVKLELEATAQEEQRHINQVLMHHGVSQSQALTVSRRAAFERKLSSQSVANVQDMIGGY